MAQDFRTNLETKALLTVGKALEGLSPEAQLRLLLYFTGIARERFPRRALALGDFDADGTILHGEPKGTTDAD